MSSAANHRKRSHRSYKQKAAAFNSFQRKQLVRTEVSKQMKARKSFFAKLMGLFQKGDK